MLYLEHYSSLIVSITIVIIFIKAHSLLSCLSLNAERKMAEAIKKLEEQLNCAICLDTYTDPKLLQCLHVFCRQCLVKLVVRDEQGQLILTCPTCRQDTPVPANGVTGFQSAFHINNLLEIQESLKEAKDPVLTSQDVVKSDEARPITSKVIPNCFEHADKERELYCETCEDLICWKCAIKGGKHHDHDHQPLNEAFEKYKQEMTSSLEPMEEKLAIVTKALLQIEKSCEATSNQQAEMETYIRDAIKRLKDILDIRETELIGKLNQITQSRIKSHTLQKEQMETIQAQLISTLNFVKESMKTGIQEEVLMMKSNVAKQVKELTTEFQPDILKYEREADIIFKTSTDVSIACQNYGTVYTPSTPDPFKCYALGKGLENAEVGKKSTVSMVVLNVEGEPCTKPLESQLQCKLVSEITGAMVRGTFERKELNKYEISYQPTLKGRHHLYIQVIENQILGSPFTVAVDLPIEKLGAPILTIDIGEMSRPFGVAFSKEGEIVVSQYSRHCISVYSPSGEILRSFGKKGSDEGEFLFPCGVALDSEGNILVTDSNHHIQRFHRNGKFLSAIGIKGSGPLQFTYPQDIIFNTTNNKIYIVDENNRVQVLNSDLTFSNTFGRPGSDKGQFYNPTGIACDSTGKVYVVDACNHRIQVFTAEGKFLRMFGRYGQGKGELKRPLGIAIDPKDIIYVSELSNDRVSVFTSEGQFITSFGTHGKEVGKFDIPVGLAVDNTGVIYVADRQNDRIQVF